MTPSALVRATYYYNHEPARSSANRSGIPLVSDNFGLYCKRLIFQDGGMARTGVGAVLVACSGLLTACIQAPSGPAPVTTSVPQRPSLPAAAGLPSAPRRSILVKPGQTLGGIAETFHIPARAIIAANNLMPPYELKVGQRLVIPEIAGRGMPTKATAPQRTRPAVGVDANLQPQRRPKRPPAEEIPLDDPPLVSSAPTTPESSAQSAPTR
jgi:LysM repeat protein